MTTGNNLSASNSSFGSNFGENSLSKKLSSATIARYLRHLSHNKNSIIKVLKKNEAVIRRGGFSSAKQASARNEIEKLEGGALTKNDAKHIKNLLKHLSAGIHVKDNKPKIKIQKQLARDEGYKLNKFDPDRGGPGFINSNNHFQNL